MTTNLSERVADLEEQLRALKNENQALRDAAARDIEERKQTEYALREKEAQFRNIIESSSMGMHMYHLEPDGRLIFIGANPAADVILGVDNHQFVGQPIEVAFPALAETKIPAMYRRAAATGQPWKTDQVTYDENEILGAFEVYAFQTSPGNMTAMFLDDTEQKRMAEKLRQNENTQRQIIDTTPNCVFVKDREGKYLVVNQKMAEMHNTTPEEMVGKFDYEIAEKWFESVEYQEFRLTEQDIIDNQKTIYIREEAFTYQDGTERWFQTTKFPFEQESNPNCLLIIATDITERVQARQLEDAVYRIAQAPDRADSLDDLYTAVHAIISDVMDANNFYIALYDEIDNLVSFPFFIDDMDVQPEPTTPGRGLTEYVLRTGKSLLRDRAVHRQLEKDGEIELVGTDSPIWLGVPLKIDNQVIGMMAVQHYSNPQAYGIREQRMLEYVSTQVAEAIARKRTENALLESEARYRGIIEDQTELILRWKPDGTRTFVNASYCRFFKRSAADLVGTNFFQEMLPVEREKVLAKLQALTPTADAVSYEEHTNIPTVGLKWMMWTDRGIFNENGELLEIQSVGRDITLRKKFESDREALLQQIQEQAQQVQQIVETVPQGVLLLDDDLKLRLINPVAEKILPVLTTSTAGERLTHLGNRPILEFLTSPPKGLWHALTISGPPETHFQVIARSLETSTDAAGWVLVIRDVTQQKTIEQYQQQQERLAAVGQLAAGIAHDFNNILGAITLYAQLTSQADDVPLVVSERMGIIFDQAMQASDLVRQILDFSRGSELERSPLDLIPILKEQTQLLRRTLPENITISFHFGKVLPPKALTANIDPTRIQQAIMNLAINARDAMPLGGALTIRLDHLTLTSNTPAPLPEMTPGDWVCLKISDTGKGIPADVLPQIFNPFFTTKGPGQGTGLGLAQVYGIVKAHEGAIQVDTAVEEGATFRIFLPAIPAEKPEQDPLGFDAFPHGAYETILVVEDNAAMRSALVEMLTNLRYRLIAVKNGTEALDIIQSTAPQKSKTHIDLVLSDVVMPEIGGVALFNQIRKLKPEIKVILMTGHPMQTELETLKLHGLVGWLSKPPDISDLAQMIATALGH